jgi:hypothetical protein
VGSHYWSQGGKLPAAQAPQRALCALRSALSADPHRFRLLLQVISCSSSGRGPGVDRQLAAGRRWQDAGRRRRRSRPSSSASLVAGPDSLGRRVAEVTGPTRCSSARTMGGLRMGCAASLQHARSAGMPCGERLSAQAKRLIPLEAMRPCDGRRGLLAPFVIAQLVLALAGAV